MAEDVPGIENPPPVNTNNDYAIGAGENLPNHSTSLQGRSKFVRQSIPVVPTFRTKQEAFRYAAYIVTMADAHLPNEQGCELHTFEEVQRAIRSPRSS